MKKALLLILDGVGYSEKKAHNAVLQANAPFYKNLFEAHPYSLLRTDGEYVGLPAGAMGNSEVGHISIGAGRIVDQDLTKITKFSTQEGFTKKAILHEITGQNTIHVMILLSDGGVHSHQDHLYSLLNFYNKEYPKQKIVLHIITDGRDTGPQSGRQYINKLEGYLREKENMSIATIAGRFYAMDRDKRWERIEKAFKNIYSPAQTYKGAGEALEAAYARGETDEFILPSKISEDVPQPEDAFIFCNFRSDRAREISMALAKKEFTKFTRETVLNEHRFICFTAYSEDFSFPVMFPKESPKKTLGEVIQNKGLKQLRIAETEKYAHVTYFFNGGEEKVFANEERIMIPSPKEVATYDLKPEMSAEELTNRLVAQIKMEKHDLIVCNYANGDMVGHTGNEAAAIKAIEILDKCLAKLVPTATTAGYSIFITADHGNCEEMYNTETGAAFTQHTMNPVPFIYIGKTKKRLTNGALKDIAPTILMDMEISIPKEMTGKSLFE